MNPNDKPGQRLSAGVYYLARTDHLLILSNVKTYEEAGTNKLFSIVTWENAKGIFKKVLITERQYSNFKKIGLL